MPEVISLSEIWKRYIPPYGEAGQVQDYKELFAGLNSWINQIDAKNFWSSIQLLPIDSPSDLELGNLYLFKQIRPGLGKFNYLMYLYHILPKWNLHRANPIFIFAFCRLDDLGLQVDNDLLNLSSLESPTSIHWATHRDKWDSMRLWATISHIIPSDFPSWLFLNWVNENPWEVK